MYKKYKCTGKYTVYVQYIVCIDQYYTLHISISLILDNVNFVFFHFRSIKEISILPTVHYDIFMPDLH